MERPHDLVEGRGTPVRSTLCVGLLACTVGYACAGPAAKPSVEVPVPAPTDAAVRDSGSQSDAAADATPIGPHIRGPVPEWPDAEQELQLLYRGDENAAEIDLAAKPSMLDLQFNVDTTASFGGEIDNMQAELSRSIIPQLSARIPDTRFGVSRFADFPISPFGQPKLDDKLVADVPFQLLTPITDRLARVTKAVNSLDDPLNQGGDVPEAGAESLYQVATGEGYRWQGMQLIAPFDRDQAAADGGGTLGGVGFRAQALRVVVHITDAPSHTPKEYVLHTLENTHGLPEATAALRAVGAHVISIVSAEKNSSAYVDTRKELSALALATGARTEPERGQCKTGIDGATQAPLENQCPLVFDAKPDGTGLPRTLVDSVVSLLDSVHFAEVHAEPGQDPLGFIERIELAPAKQKPGVSEPNTADRLPNNKPDGVKDSYLDVNQDQRLTFRIVLKNERIAPSDIDQRYRVSIRLLGDGVLLEERYLRVMVPAQLRAADRDE